MKVQPIKFQQGGQAPAPQAAAPAPEAQAQGAGPEEQIMQMAQEIVQQVGPEGAMMLAEAIMQMVQGMGGQQGGAPAPEGEPVFKFGGILDRRI